MAIRKGWAENSRRFYMQRSFRDDDHLPQSDEVDRPTILDKRPWDSTAIFIFFCHFSVPS